MMGRGMGRQEDQRLDEVGSGDRRRLSLLVAQQWLGRRLHPIAVGTEFSACPIGVVRCWRSRRENLNLNHVGSCSLFSTHCDFSMEQGPPKSPTPYLGDLWRGLRGLETEGGGPSLVGWLAQPCEPCSIRAWGRRFPTHPSSTPIQRHLITHLNSTTFDPSSPPHILHNAGRTGTWVHSGSPALPNLHSSLAFWTLSGISVPKQASRGAR